MKLFTNTLLSLTLTRFIIEPKLRLKCGFFAKRTGKKKLFFFSNQPRTIHKKKPLFIYNPTIYLFNKLKNIYRFTLKNYHSHFLYVKEQPTGYTCLHCRL